MTAGRREKASLEKNAQKKGGDGQQRRTFRVMPFMLQRVTALLKDTPQLMKKQADYEALKKTREEFLEEEGGGVTC